MKNFTTALTTALTARNAVAPSKDIQLALNNAKRFEKALDGLFGKKAFHAIAEKLIKRCIDAVTAGKKVLISFVLGDLWTNTYTVSKDTKYHKKGDVAVTLKSRLLRIKMIKIDGELKYKEATANTDVAPQQNEPIEPVETKAPKKGKAA